VRPAPAGGVVLLTAAEAARILGRFRLPEDHGLTPIACYREDEVLELRDAMAPAPGNIRIGQAAYILGVGVETVRRAASEGLLTRDERGLYDSAEVRALHEARQGGKLLRPRA
jgi:hypothetical protein